MNYKFIFIVIFSTIISMIGTVFGAFVGISIKNPTDRWLGASIGFAAGLMFSISIFELIPEAVHKNDFFSTVLFTGLGIVLIFIINNISDYYRTDADSHIKVAFMVALGLMLHNFPEGLIMGVGFMAGESLGMKMSILIAIHDIPEGIAVSAPLLVSKVKKSKILFYSLLTALPTAIGCWIGLFIGRISTYILGSSLAITAGVMLYVVCEEMLKETVELSGKLLGGFSVLCGGLFGIMIIYCF